MIIELSKSEIEMIKGVLELEIMRLEIDRSKSESVREFDEFTRDYVKELKRLRTIFTNKK